MAVATTAALTVAVAACGSSSDGGGSTSASSSGGGDAGGVQTVKISHLADLSGATKEANEAQIRGMDLALADPEIQALEREGRFRIEIDRKDTGGDPSRALAAMQRNASDDSIVLQMGPSNTPEFFAAIPLADQLKLPTYSFMSGGVYPGKFNPYTWRTGFKDDDAIPPLVDYAGRDLGARSAAVIYASDNDFAKFGGELFVRDARAAGMDVTSETVAIADTSFSAQVSAIVADDPDAIFLSVLPQQAGFIVKALRDAGTRAPILASGNAVSAQLVYENSKGAAEGLLVSTPFDPSSSDPKVRAYVDAFAARYPRFVPSYDVFAYDGIHEVAAALAAAAATGEISRDSVREVFGRTRIDGLTGELEYRDGYGDATRGGIKILRLEQPGRFGSLDG